MPAPSADPDRFDEAMRAWRRRVPIPDSELAAIERDIDRRAFMIANVSEARVVQDVFDALDRAIENGTTLDAFKDDVGEMLAEAWGGEDATRLETVFRTNVMSAYNEGRDEIFNDPAVREARPFKQMDGTNDSRECETCEPIDGTVLPADDPFWASHQCPLHPNCRCIVRALTPAEAEDEGIADAAPDHEPPAEGFGGSREYDPDLSGFAPGIRAVLRDKLE